MTAQSELIDRVRADLHELEAVRGVWLTGSLGTGTDDEWSDVDMFVLVDDEDRPAFVASWPHFAAGYQPLLVKQIPGAPVFAHVLPGWLRWDVTVGGHGDLAGLDRDRVLELFSRHGESAGTAPHRPPDPHVVREMTEEFLRVLGLLPVVVRRGEAVMAASGAALLRQMLTTLLRYQAEGSRMSGALHLSRVLRQDQVAALRALPPAYADLDAAVRLHIACAAMFLPVARDLLRGDYPARLDEACRIHLRAELSLELPD
jgi:hypothetical protein